MRSIGGVIQSNAGLRRWHNHAGAGVTHRRDGLQTAIASSALRDRTASGADAQLLKATTSLAIHGPPPASGAEAIVFRLLEMAIAARVRILTWLDAKRAVA